MLGITKKTVNLILEKKTERTVTFCGDNSSCQDYWKVFHCKEVRLSNNQSINNFVYPRDPYTH